MVTCEPAALVASIFDDPITRALVLDRVFGDPDWVDFDRGLLPRDLAIDRAVQRTGLSTKALEALFDALPHALVPVPEVIELIETLRTAGNRLFVLSNMHPISLAHLESAYDVFALFEGRIVSCEVGLCKPDLAIYRRLLEAFELEPADTVFIDDVQANLDPAAALGMRTIRFETVEACRSQLIAMGCILDRRSTLDTKSD